MTVTYVPDLSPAPGAPPGPPAPAPASRSATFTVLTLAVAALLVAALAYFVVDAVDQRATISRLRAEDSLSASALRAATADAVYLSSYDYRHLTGPGTPWTEVDQNSTASFRNDFDATRSNLAKVLTDYQATATGTVVQAAVQSADSKSAVVLLFVNQTVTNSAEKPGSQTQPLRVVLTLTRQDGKWLIDKLSAS